MLAVALASGGVAALLAMRYLRQQSNLPVLAPPKNGDLVVAARPLPLGTVLGDADVKTIEWTGAALPVGYATAKADVVGRGVMSPLPGERADPRRQARAQGRGRRAPGHHRPGEAGADHAGQRGAPAWPAS